MQYPKIRRKNARAFLAFAAGLIAFSSFSCSQNMLDDIKADIEEARQESGPEIATFSCLNDSATTYDGVVEFRITATVAGTNATAITHYYVSENSAAPAASVAGWAVFSNGAVESTYTFSDLSAHGTRPMYAWVKNDLDVLSAAATFNVNYSGVAQPVIASFDVTPTTTYDRSVGYTLTASAAGAGASSITHYLITETSTAPVAEASGWTAFTSPQTGVYQVTAASHGIVNLYAWVKNDHGMVSNPYIRSVTYAPYGAPVITAFVLGSAVTYDRDVGFSITATAAGAGATSITHYLVNESSTAPAAGAAGWAAFTTPQIGTYQVTIPSYGTANVYAWLKNEQGVVSAAYTPQAVTYSAYGAPLVASFSVGSAVTYDREVDFTIAASVAGVGASSITHYLVNESSTAPAAGAAGWTAFSSPQSGTHTISRVVGDYGTTNLYAWLKNDQSVVSAAFTPRSVSYDPYGAPVVDPITGRSASPTNDPTITFDAPTASPGGGSSTISGWLITESAVPPALADVNLAAPTSYTVGLTSGQHTLYFWAKNEHSKLSAARTTIVDINAPQLNWGSPYVDGYEMAAHDAGLTLVGANVDLNPAIAGSGIGTGQYTLLGDNRTITIKPGAAGNGLWDAGSGSLTVTGTSAYGIPFSKSISLVVFNGVCVISTASDANPGTTTSPVQHIAYAMSMAQTTYEGAGRSSEIRICKTGTYETDWNAATGKIVVREGMSLLGGYPSTFQNSGRSLDVNNVNSLTTVTDTSSGGGAAYTSANRVFDIDTEGITRATVIEGFNIVAGGGAYSVGIHIYDSDSDTTYICPTIRNNRISAGSAATTTSAALYAYGSAPLIELNRINGDSTAFSGNSALTTNSGLYLYQCAAAGATYATVSRNTIWGPQAATNSYAILADAKSGSSITIEKNEIRSGKSLNPVGISIYDGGSIHIHNNLIFVGYGTSTASIPKLVRMDSASPYVYLRNNTMIFGVADGSNPNVSYGIWFNASLTNVPYVQNNIFRADSRGTANTCYCVYETAATTPVFQQNLWYDDQSTTKYLYHDSGGTNYSTVATLESSSAATASGNDSSDPLLSGSYGLQAASPQAAREDAIDGSAASWPFSDDKASANRPSGSWSMGCYQYF